MDTTRDLQIPSGCEVGGAVLHPHVHDDFETALTVPDRSGMRAKLESLKSRGLSRVHDIQRVVRDRGTSVKDQLRTTRYAVSDGAKAQVTRVNESMRSNPMLWAGIAAGAGFGLGLIGRVAQWRSRQQRRMPDLIIIESGC
jgi:ElaB/YqjD/DUF883 family membrane-anchored ribosome-binding protein